MKIIASFLLGLGIVLVGYFSTRSVEQPQALGAFSDPFLSVQLAPSPVNTFCLTTNGTDNVWSVCSGGGGGDSTLFVYDTANNQIYTDGASTTATTTFKSSLFIATSTTGTSTFAGDIQMTHNHWFETHGIQGDASDGLYIRANNGTLVSDFGIGNSANSTFYGAVNIDGATRLATSLTGLLKATAGTVATAVPTVDYSTLSTSTAPSVSNLAYWTGVSSLGAVATGTLTESVSGLELDATRSLIGGAAVLSLTSGFVIPSTTPWSNINNFYAVPSGVISAGDALTWSSNTLNFDGGASPSGDLGGTWASPSVTDDSHNHTGTTLSSIDISDDTNLSADGTEIVLTGDALSLGTALTFTTGTSTTSFFTGLLTATNAVINTLLTALNVTITGLLDIGAGVLEIPNGANPTADDVGEIAHDTTDNQLILDDYVIRTKDEIYKFAIPSTSPAFATGTTKYLPPIEDGYTVTDIFCSVEGGTSKVVLLFGETITCDVDGQADDGTITISTVGAASTTVPVTASSTSGYVNWLNVTITGRYTRE